jgi:hypothetical protein
MRRIILVVTVALVMAAMMAMAMPAFADHSTGHTQGQDIKEVVQRCQEAQDRPGASECAYGHYKREGA